MTRSIVRRALAVLAAVTLAACDSATSGSLRLDITPDKPQYTPGTTVLLTIRNLGDEPVNFSFCGREIQRETATGWVTVSAELVSCTRIGLVLAPGASATGHVELPTDLPAGRYRVYLPLVGGPADDEAGADLETRKSSKPFEVTVG